MSRISWICLDSYPSLDISRYNLIAVVVQNISCPSTQTWRRLSIMNHAAICHMRICPSPNRSFNVVSWCSCYILLATIMYTHVGMLKPSQIDPQGGWLPYYLWMSGSRFFDPRSSHLDLRCATVAHPTNEPSILWQVPPTEPSPSPALFVRASNMGNLWKSWRLEKWNPFEMPRFGISKLDVLLINTGWCFG